MRPFTLVWALFSCHHQFYVGCCYYRLHYSSFSRSIIMLFRLSALFSGLVFGFGLILSGMTNPAKIIGFLDVFGDWDPSLALVMAGAIAVTLPAFYFLKKRQKTWLNLAFSWPTREAIDTPLIVGSVLFGVGWGLAGLCPGPST